MLFALYIPRTEELLTRMAVIVGCWAVFTYCGVRMRFGLLVTALGTFLGGALFILPGIVHACFANLGGYGDLCRTTNESKLGDWFWVFTTYLHVDWGSVLAVAGQAAGLVIVACTRAFLRRHISPPVPELGLTRRCSGGGP